MPAIMEEGMLPGLTKLWNICFGDGKEYVEEFFRGYGEGRTTYVWKEEGQLAGMASDLRCRLMRKGTLYPARYQYAGGVFPEFRGRGIFPKLLAEMREEAVGRGEATFFVPGPGLLDYYKGMGYRELFPVKEAVIDASQAEPLSLTAALPEEYLAARDRRFAGDGYVAWDLSHIRYAIRECEAFGGGAFLTGAKGEYLLIGGKEEGTLRIAEAVMPEERIAVCVKGAAAAFGCERAVVRLPAWSKIPGEIKSFGVGYGPNTEGMERPYLNLTLD